MFLKLTKDPDGYVLANKTGFDRGKMVVLGFRYMTPSEGPLPAPGERRAPTHILVWTKGGNYWAGRGMRGYSGATFETYEVQEELVPGREYRVRGLGEMEGRWKEQAQEFGEQYDRIINNLEG